MRLIFILTIAFLCSRSATAEGLLIGPLDANGLLDLYSENVFGSWYEHPYTAPTQSGPGNKIYIAHFLNQDETTYSFDIVSKGNQSATTSRLLISAYMEPYSWWHVGALNATPPTMDFWFEVIGNELISTTTTTGGTVAELLFPNEGITTVRVNIENRTPGSFLWCYGSECDLKKHIDYGVIQLTFYNILVPESDPIILIISGLTIILTKQNRKKIILYDRYCPA